MKDSAKHVRSGLRTCAAKLKRKTPWLAKGKKAVTHMWMKNMADRMEEACNDSGLTLSDTF
jgi:hypothetical protein